MLRTGLAVAAVVAATGVAVSAALGDHGGPRPLKPDAQWTTVFKPPAGVGIEGLTVDRRGNLYTPGRGVVPCPVFRVSGGASAVVGNLPGPCNPAGLAFGGDGRLYIADAGRIMVLRPSAESPPTAEVYATDVPGSNGVAFDRRGDLWVTDGTTAQGRVWRIGRDRVPQEVFRIQPIANDVIDAAAGISGIGRDNRGLPPGTIAITPTGRQASNTLGSQHLVANGIAFTDDGDIVVADTARGAIWKVYLDRHGRVQSRMGCDSTFTANTLCLDNIVVQHPYLEGADGIVLDDDDNIFVAANERNAVAVVTERGRVVEWFRNPVGGDRLRNAGPLEFPTSPVLVGRKLCMTNSDGGRRDNFPAAAGEGPKINCV
jgi:sugar lactone lactonase YvrE